MKQSKNSFLLNKKLLFTLAATAYISIGASGAFAAPEQAASKQDDMADDDYYLSQPTSQEAPIYDPIEGFNRSMFTFNEWADKLVLRPVAKGYRFVVPQYGRERVHNVLVNMSEPVVTFNSFLQGNPERGFKSFWRFILNSSFGVLGIFDFAGANMGLNYDNEDFGQTMGHYGWGSGPYIVIPLLGPSSGRDLFGRVVDTASDPFNYVDSDAFVYGRAAVGAIDARERSLDLTDEIYDTSVDPYATIRSMYLQRREALVRNNQPKEAETGL